MLNLQDRFLISPHLDVKLGLRNHLEQRHGDQVRVLLRGRIGSIVAEMATGREAEAGILGHEA